MQLRTTSWGAPPPPGAGESVKPIINRPLPRKKEKTLTLLQKSSVLTKKSLNLLKNVRFAEFQNNVPLPRPVNLTPCGFSLRSSSVSSAGGSAEAPDKETASEASAVAASDGSVEGGGDRVIRGGQGGREGSYSLA